MAPTKASSGQASTGIGEGNLHFASSVGTAPSGDIIFLHGLDGDPRTTWQSADQDRFYWPEALSQDLPSFDVWSLGYSANSSAWSGSTMPLVDRATNLLAVLEANGIGSRPIVFICHSLGGLVVKQALRHTATYANQSWMKILPNVRGLVFLSTPHSGSELADLLHYMKFLLPSVSTQDLQSQAPQLRDLNLWFRNSLGHGSNAIPMKVFYEKQRTRGLLVVNDSSADPGIPNVYPVPLDENHISICKPVSRETILYKLVTNFIEETIPVASLAISSRGASPEDRKRLKEYFVVFDRQVFKVPCIFEGALSWVDEALQNVLAAMGTGALRTRDGEFAKSVSAISEFETAQYRADLDRIRKIIVGIRVTLYELARHISAEQKRLGRHRAADESGPDGSAKNELSNFHHMEFTLQDLITAGASHSFVKQAFALMDQIDDERNALIRRLNQLFKSAGLTHRLKKITLSSELLKLSARKLRKNDWSNYYLRTHELLLPFLETGTIPRNTREL